MKDCTKVQDGALVFMRLVLGSVFIWAGYSKMFIWTAPLEGMTPMMINLTKFLGIVEPLGGLALILGLLTRWASAGLGIIMLGSLYFVYFMYNAPVFTGMSGIGLDYNVLLLAGSVTLAAFGAGNWSVDALCCKNKK